MKICLFVLGVVVYHFNLPWDSLEFGNSFHGKAMQNTKYLNEMKELLPFVWISRYIYTSRTTYIGSAAYYYYF